MPNYFLQILYFMLYCNILLHLCTKRRKLQIFESENAKNGLNCAFFVTTFSLKLYTANLILFLFKFQRPLVAYFWTCTFLIPTKPPEGEMTLETVRYSNSQLPLPPGMTIERKFNPPWVHSCVVVWSTPPESTQIPGQII